MSRFARAAAALTTALVLTGCGVADRGLYDTPLPGGADVGKDPITLTANFEDVLDLVPQSAVKVDNVPVGRVTKITLNPTGTSARVTLLVNRDAKLPSGTTARLEQSSLLGEKFVALVRPDPDAQPAADVVGGPDLSNGDTIALAGTTAAAEVEQVFGALSAVLNGGGIEQFQEISRELQKVSKDRPAEIKDFLRSMNGFVTTLDDRKEAIVAAIDALNRLSGTLSKDKAKLTRALDGLEPGMAVIADQRTQLVAMLESLDRLSEVSVDVLDKSADDIVADFQALDPILRELAQAGRDLPDALEILLTYPFPDSVLKAIKGDYLNAFIVTNFRTLPVGCTQMGCDWPQVADPNARVEIRGDGGARVMRMPKAVTSPSASPSLLPPTASPTPAAPGPTMAVPSDSVPRPRPTPTPAAPGPTKPAPSDSGPRSQPTPSPTTDRPSEPEPSTPPDDEPPAEEGQDN